MINVDQISVITGPDMLRVCAPDHVDMLFYCDPINCFVCGEVAK